MESSEAVLQRTSPQEVDSKPQIKSDGQESTLSNPLSAARLESSTDQLIISETLSTSDDATVVQIKEYDTGFALTVTADEIVAELNKLLAQELPDGIESLDPNDFTPEATASRITDQIAGLFPAFREQNPQLSDEEAVEEFMELASSGVEQGYKEAFDILDGLGAFQIDGIEDTIEKTLGLLREKLSELEVKLKESLGIEPKELDATSDETDNPLPPTTESNPTLFPLLAEVEVEPTTKADEPYQGLNPEAVNGVLNSEPPPTGALTTV